MKPAPSRPLASALVLAVAVSGCGRSAAPGGEKGVVVAYPVDIQGVNEMTTQSTTINNGLIYFAWFLQLVEEQPDYQKGPPSFEPRLAASYEFSDDRLQLTFRLRPDVTWSDGVPVTSEDVRWTWQVHTHPEVAWVFSEAKKRITDVEAVDPHRVVFHFSEAYAAQLQDANFGVILPKHAWSRLPLEEWRENNDWFVENLVVDGPFTLESWQPQQRFILRRNERYFEPDYPKLDRVVFEVTPDNNSRLALLRSGQAQMVEAILAADAATIVAHPRLELLSYIPRFFFFVSWNVQRPQFQAKEVRQALTLGIDRREIVESLYYGYATVSSSPFPSDLWARNRELVPWPYDPARAKELLAAQGWVDTDGDGIRDRDGQPFSFELVTNSESQVRADIIVMIKEHLRRIGVEVRPRTMEFNALLVPLGRHEFDAAFQGMAIDTSLNLSYFFHTDAIDGGYNWSGYSSPQVDELIEATIVEVDQMAAKPLYDELQALLHEELPVTFLYEARRLSGVDKRLRDVDPNALSSFFNIRRWRLEDRE